MTQGGGIATVTRRTRHRARSIRNAPNAVAPVAISATEPPANVAAVTTSLRQRDLAALAEVLLLRFGVA